MKRLNLRPWESAGLAAGRITALCRVVKPQAECDDNGAPYWYTGGYRAQEYVPCRQLPSDWKPDNPIRSPFGAPGTVIAGCEAWRLIQTDGICGAQVKYEADGSSAWKVETSVPPTYTPDIKRSAKTMPTWAVRTWLTVVSVRCCRVQEIGEAKIAALGFEFSDDNNDRAIFAQQFDRDNGPGGYAANKWVWIAEVKVNAK